MDFYLSIKMLNNLLNWMFYNLEYHNFWIIIFITFIILMIFLLSIKLTSIFRDVIYVIIKNKVQDKDIKKHESLNKKYKDKKHEIMMNIYQQKDKFQEGNINNQQMEHSSVIDNDNTKIVGVQKPIGRWTKMVLQNNMQYINIFKNLINKNNKENKKTGFWQLFIQAKSGKFTEKDKTRGK